MGGLQFEAENAKPASLSLKTICGPNCCVVQQIHGMLQCNETPRDTGKSGAGKIWRRERGPACGAKGIGRG
jgi:hypothetical protein